jgi:hypothetical protein
VSVTALRDAHGAIIGYLLIGTDSTARKLVEEEQKKSDQRLRDQQFYTRSLIESNIDALMTIDVGPDLERLRSDLDPMFGQVRQQACRIAVIVLGRLRDHRHDLNGPR